jgi:glycosyltransferase involved in cell wall biosynthesis|tara:strand:+ start:160 stop:840 length:681 start_codon:yes stop_codon:yes gene_type:complete
MDCIFSMSEEMAEYLLSEGIDQSQLFNVNNFVDVEGFQAFTGHNRLADEVNLGLFGRLIARKRVDVALHAFAELLGQNGMESVRLHVAGDGPLREDLIGISEDLELGDQVCFHGHLDNPFPLMSRMDLVLLTSEAEGTPRCLMEAMSMGKTCVTSDIAGVRHLVVEGLTGYRFRPGDSTDLANRLRHIITMKQYIPSGDLFDFMKSNFDAEVCSRKMLTYLEDLYS